MILRQNTQRKMHQEEEYIPDLQKNQRGANSHDETVKHTYRLVICK